MSGRTTLEVYQTGRLCVLGFGGREVLDNLDLGVARDTLADLVKEHQCEAMAFDLTGVRLIPSGLLGLLASIHKLNVQVHLYNPSKDIREVLEITRLDQVMEIHEVAVS